MIQRRLFSLFFVLLLVFAQQQAALHAHVHLANGSENTSQQNSTNDKQAPAHSEACGKCIVLAGIGAAAGSHALVIHVLPATFKFAIEVATSVTSSTYLPYQSRAPPYSIQA